DKAMIIETLTLMNKRKEAAPIVKSLSKKLNSNKWMSTQTTAYSLLAISKFSTNKKGKKGMQFTYNVNGQTGKVNTKYPLTKIDMKIKNAKGGNIEIKNNAGKILYAQVVTEGIPAMDKRKPSYDQMDMDVNYTDLDGHSINVKEIEQGTDFIAEVTITNPGNRGDYKQLALTQVFPSGWEIHNTRMNKLDLDNDPSKYQDIRDDRIHTYFDLEKGESKTYRFLLNASYAGKFFMPPVYCEAMYDNSIKARNSGKWVKVVGQSEATP
ncbi:MAG: hypothetical protein ABEH43_01120, partial [Flavobacteriales bacterium]